MDAQAAPHWVAEVPERTQIGGTPGSGAFSNHSSVGASTAVFGAIGLLGGVAWIRRRRRGQRGSRAWAPVAVEAAEAQADALEMASKEAKIDFFGGLAKSDPYATLNSNLIHYKQLLVTGSYSQRIDDFKTAWTAQSNSDLKDRDPKKWKLFFTHSTIHREKNFARLIDSSGDIEGDASKAGESSWDRSSEPDPTDSMDQVPF